MKARNLGRLELLAWVNEICETDYPKVELCSDAIAYCQILDAIHPGAQVPLHRLNFNAKNKDDYTRNLKVLDDVITKLKANKRIQIEQMANGKF
jgi:microtubule-associated protein, RP/EB family